jgi:hypothetical protein
MVVVLVRVVLIIFELVKFISSPSLELATRHPRVGPGHTHYVCMRQGMNSRVCA